MKKGFTLIELLITIVIIGILATLAIPNYTNMVEKARADQAITYLKVIRTGEKIYYANNFSYTTCTNLSELKDRIGAEVTQENYFFSVTSDTAATFLATAARNTDSKTITVDQAGTWDGTSPWKPSN